jgi:hypothetical protein
MRRYIFVQTSGAKQPGAEMRKRVFQFAGCVFSRQAFTNAVQKPRALRRGLCHLEVADVKRIRLWNVNGAVLFESRTIVINKEGEALRFVLFDMNYFRE